MNIVTVRKYPKNYTTISINGHEIQDVLSIDSRFDFGREKVTIVFLAEQFNQLTCDAPVPPPLQRMQKRSWWARIFGAR